MISIDTHSVKAAPFVQEERGIDGNKRVTGRKRHVLTDTLGLVWGGVIHAANQADGSTAERVVALLRGYMYRMKKILADAAYKQTFSDWVLDNLLGVELELASRPPTEKGFVPVKWRWVTERTFGTFNRQATRSFRRLDKDHEKTTQSGEAWVLWRGHPGKTVKLFLTV